MAGSHRGQKRAFHTLELDYLSGFVSHRVDTGPLPEQQGLLIAEPSPALRIYNKNVGGRKKKTNTGFCPKHSYLLASTLKV